MKINKLVALSAAGLMIVSCGKQLKTTKTLTTELDSVSYAIGANMGQQMRVNGKEISQDLFVQGFFNGRDSSNMLIPTKDLRNVINSYFQKKRQEDMIKQQEEQAKKAEETYGENKKAGEDFLANNKTKAGVKTTASGLQYEVVKEGNGEKPKLTDRVKVLYKGMLIDGTVFDSNENRKTPSEFGITQVIKGWTEGLQLMSPGAKYKLYIPQELAYGPQQRGKHIKPLSALVFDVELIDIVNKK